MIPAAAALLWLTAALSPTPPLAHPGHTSYAEVSVDAKQRQLQVSLGMLAIDFEKTLSRRAGQRVNLDTTKGVEEMIERYLADRFVVTLADGTKPKPRFAGREDAGKNVWVYFTISLATKQTGERPPRPDAEAKGSLLAGVQLCDRVLMELNRGQRNVVEVREGAWRRYLTCTEKAPQHVLRPTVKPKKRGA